MPTGSAIIKSRACEGHGRGGRNHGGTPAYDTGARHLAARVSRTMATAKGSPCRQGWLQESAALRPRGLRDLAVVHGHSLCPVWQCLPCTTSRNIIMMNSSLRFGTVTTGSAAVIVRFNTWSARVGAATAQNTNSYFISGDGIKWIIPPFSRLGQAAHSQRASLAEGHAAP